MGEMENIGCVPKKKKKKAPVFHRKKYIQC